MDPLLAKKLVSYGLSLVRGKAVAEAKGLLSGHSADVQLQRAIAADQRMIVEILRRAAIEIVRGITERDLDGDQALQFLITRAADPTTPRRLRALWNEAATSTDERVAMLAVGYLVGADSPSARERLDWALRGLFPADADALGIIVEVGDQLTPGEHLLLEERDDARGSWLVAKAVHASPLGDRRGLYPHSVIALANAQCIALSDWMNQPGSGLMMGLPRGTGRARSLEILPLGRELHRILATLDWREIARRRSVG